MTYRYEVWNGHETGNLRIYYYKSRKWAEKRYNKLKKNGFIHSNIRYIGE